LENAEKDLKYGLCAGLDIQNSLSRCEMHTKFQSEVQKIRKRQIGRYKSRWEESVKIVVKEVDSEGMD
jgi:hypothetical protein